MEFLDSKSIDYIICHPNKVPAAKISSAQAHIKAVASKLYFYKSIFRVLNDEHCI
jgi:hypothetical protein